MYQFYILAITSSLLLASPAWAQKTSAEQAVPCVAVPIFHCVQNLKGGSVIGHFGYDLQCPGDAGTAAEMFIDINDDNLFSTKRIDRGQPKIFLSGKHIDEFEVEFSAEEAKSGSDIHWSVLGRTAKVDFSKTKDGSLDCSILPK
jgi:hypothetical protein